MFFSSPRLAIRSRLALRVKCRVRLAWLIKRLLCRLNENKVRKKKKVLNILVRNFLWKMERKRHTSAAARVTQAPINVCVRNKSAYTNCVSLRMFEFEEMCVNKYRYILRWTFNHKFKINVFLSKSCLLLFLHYRYIPISIKVASEKYDAWSMVHSRGVLL